MNERNSVTVFGGAVLLAAQIGGALANIMRKTSLQSVLQKSEQSSVALYCRRVIASDRNFSKGINKKLKKRAIICENGTFEEV